MSRLLNVRNMAVVMVMLVIALSSTAMADNITVTGEVNDNYQLIADGQIYEIADTPVGNELAENHISEKVKVVGTVQDSDDLKIITVVSYQVLAE